MLDGPDAKRLHQVETLIEQHFRLKVLGDLHFFFLEWKLRSSPKGFTYAKGNTLCNFFRIHRYKIVPKSVQRMKRSLLEAVRVLEADRYVSSNSIT